MIAALPASAPREASGAPVLLTVLHVAPLMQSPLSGMSAAVRGMLEAQGRLPGVRVALLRSRETGEPAAQPLPCPQFTARPARLGRLLPGLPAPFGRPSLLVLHSTYVPMQVALALEAAARQLPYVLVPHGGLTRGVQRARRLKKALVNAAGFRALVRHASAVHFLSAQEARDSEGWARRSFVVGNGTQLPPEEACARPGSHPGLRFVFLGRLDPVQKGLDLVLEACAQLRGPLAQRAARVELWGPDHRGSERVLRERIAALGLQQQVHLCGVATGARKEAVLREADVLLHPSRFEGHPMAVLEALARGLPCLVTPGTGMCEAVTAARAGWGVEPSAQAVAGAMRSALEAAAPALQQLGRGARRLAAEQYGWDTMARAAVQQYAQLAVQGAVAWP